MCVSPQQADRRTSHRFFVERSSPGSCCTAPSVHTNIKHLINTGKTFLQKSHIKVHVSFIRVLLYNELKLFRTQQFCYNSWLNPLVTIKWCSFKNINHLWTLGFVVHVQYLDQLWLEKLKLQQICFDHVWCAESSCDEISVVSNETHTHTLSEINTVLFCFHFRSSIFFLFNRVHDCCSL